MSGEGYSLSSEGEDAETKLGEFIFYDLKNGGYVCACAYELRCKLKKMDFSPQRIEELVKKFFVKVREDIERELDFKIREKARRSWKKYSLAYLD